MRDPGNEVGPPGVCLQTSAVLGWLVLSLRERKSFILFSNTIVLTNFKCTKLLFSKSQPRYYY